MGGRGLAAHRLVTGPERMSLVPAPPSLRVDQAAGLPARFVRALWWAWVLFVVYGSLVPLEFQAITLEQALASFASIPMLDIGLEGRADWIANGVLYVPVGFLTAASLAGQGIGRRLLNSVLAIGFGLALAVAVEFSQLYFPPRTVSINDLVAEGLGTAVGALLAWRGTAWLAGLQTVLRGHWREVAAVLVPAGALVVLLVSLFPFDVLVSSAELSDKASGSFWGWWMAPEFAQESLIRQLARLVAETAVLVPLGALWARSVLVGQRSATAQASLLAAWWLGAGFGVIIEVGQWFMASGVSQGLSVLTRGTGWLLGAWLWNRRLVWSIDQWRKTLSRWVWPLAALHLWAVVVLSGLGGGAWRSVEDAVARLSSGELRFVPFYYHYYTSEAVALQSLLTIAFLYAPVGLWCWVSSLSVRHAAWIAAGVALVVEFGKLFPLESRPDPTNVLIAATAAALCVQLLHRFFEPGREVEPVQALPAVSPARTGSAGTVATRASVWLILPVFVGAAAWLFHFPVLQWPVGLALMVGASLVWWRPVWLFGVVAAALPSFDLSALSGREYVDEFDVLLLIVVVIAWVRQPLGGATPAQDRWLGAVLGVFVMSAVVAVVVALRPWELAALQNPDTPLSPWQAVRPLKGLLWALCLFVLARRQHANQLPVVRSFGVGLVVGLAYVSCFVFWERAAFAGLWDFSTPYRAAGPVMAMRLGGVYLDAFLVSALPFALLGALFGKSAVWRVFCSLVALAAAYAVVVTFTRTTHLAAVVVCAFVAIAGHRAFLTRRLGALTSAALLVVLVAMAYPLAISPFASSRLAIVGQDFQIRIDHFRNVVRIGGQSASAWIFGNGLGQYPSRTYWDAVSQAQDGTHKAMHRFLRQEGVSQLQLGPGPDLYLDQFVELHGAGPVELALEARSIGGSGSMAVYLCQKWLLSSENCVVRGFDLKAGEPGWQSFSASIETEALRRSDGWLGRPVRLAIQNSGAARVDIRQISLRTAQGNELLQNGNFASAGDHWSYTSDDHRSWRVLNIFLAVWFDQGVFGLVAFVLLVGTGLVRGFSAASSGDQSSLALTAALVGLVVVSLFDSFTGEPRYVLLLVCLTWMASMRSSHRVAGPVVPAPSMPGKASRGLRV
ncbi:VanZ family protein [Hydrogenophaga sp. PBL-H3]|nr:VanZ family protein [Hydrogenophaga sp. PBL-H3]QHE81127.1 VanZ family protein [Hydrogenophaga sp. PBL-H3]